MKAIFKLIFTFFGLLFIVALIRTIFSMLNELHQKESTMNRFFGDEPFFLFFFSLVIILITASLFYAITNLYLKNKKKSLIVSGIYALITLSIYSFIFFNNFNSIPKNEDSKNIGEIEEASVENGNNDGIEIYNYDERLIKFEFPFELTEQNLEKNTFNNKSFFSENFGVVFIELDADKMQEETNDDSIPELIEKFNDLTYPKFIIKNNFKNWFKQKITDDDIQVMKVDENYYTFNVALDNGFESMTYFNRDGNYFSILNIINNQDEFAKIVSIKTQGSVIMK